MIENGANTLPGVSFLSVGCSTIAWLKKNKYYLDNRKLKINITWIKVPHAVALDFLKLLVNVTIGARKANY